MTTPAVDINSTLINSQVHLQNYLLANNQLVSETLTSSLVRRAVDFRPPSTNGVFVRGGWRTPTNWNHTVLRGSVFAQSVCRIDKHLNDLTYSIIEQTPVHTSALSSFPESGFDSSLGNKAVTSALLKLKGKGPNIGVLIGERHETLRMFADAAVRTAQLYRRFRHNNPKDWAKVLQHDALPASRLPESWLQVQYGVKPFIDDVQSALEFCNKLAQVRPPVFTVKGNARRISRYDVDMLHDGNNLVTRIHDEISKTAFVRLDYIQTSPLEASLASLGITNPFLLAWELLPYSFVADWFVGVGDYVSTWDAAFGFQFLSGSLSEKVLTVRSGMTQLTPGRKTGYGSARLRARRIDFKRTVYRSSPLPRTPVFKDPTSYGHAANLASLVVAALQRPEKRMKIR